MVNLELYIQVFVCSIAWTYMGVVVISYIMSFSKLNRKYLWLYVLIWPILLYKHKSDE